MGVRDRIENALTCIGLAMKRLKGVDEHRTAYLELDIARCELLRACEQEHASRSTASGDAPSLAAAGKSREDTHLWPIVSELENPPTIRATANGSIGIQVGGLTIYKTLEEWHALALADLDARTAELRHRLQPAAAVEAPCAEDVRSKTIEECAKIAEHLAREARTAAANFGVIDAADDNARHLGEARVFDRAAFAIRSLCSSREDVTPDNPVKGGGS